MIRLANYAKPYLGHIVITILASIGCSIANVWIIDILKQVIDESVEKVQLALYCQSLL